MWCTAASNANLIRCGDKNCNQGESCCAWKPWYQWRWNYECYNPQYFKCEDGVKCVDSTCDSLCRNNNLGSGSCSYSRVTPASNEFSVAGKKITCYCERYSLSRCIIRGSRIDRRFSVSVIYLPKQIHFQQVLDVSPECSDVIFRIKNNKGEVVSSASLSCRPSPLLGRYCTVEFSITVDEVPSVFSVEADKGGGIIEDFGRITVEKDMTTRLELELEPYKPTYNLYETGASPTKRLYRLSNY